MLLRPLHSCPTSPDSVFTFTAGSLPVAPLSFHKQPRHASSRSRKRSRPLSDIDDQPSGSKKKRRLRLILITSRLSLPFSTPATHIADRGISKIAVWAKQKRLLPQGLHKAAIMNRIRKRALEREAWLRKDSAISVGEDEREEARQMMMEKMTMQEPNMFRGYMPTVRRTIEQQHKAPEPSPLGLSNYDALDDEDGFYEEDDHDDGESTSHASKTGRDWSKALGSGGYYSDFNFLDSSNEDRDEDGDEYDDPFSLSLLPVGIIKDKRPPSPPDDKIIELMQEKERQREMIFLQFG